MGTQYIIAHIGLQLFSYYVQLAPFSYEVVTEFILTASLVLATSSNDFGEDIEHRQKRNSAQPPLEMSASVFFFTEQHLLEDFTRRTITRKNDTFTNTGTRCTTTDAGNCTHDSAFDPQDIKVVFFYRRKLCQAASGTRAAGT